MSDAEHEGVGQIGVADDAETTAEKWETVGRSLVAERLNTASSEAYSEFGEVSSKVRRGEEPTKDDVEKLYAQVEQLKFAVETLAEIVPGSRRKDLNEYMTREELEDVAERVQEDREGRN